MGDILTYKEELIKAMKMLAEDERVIFIGQNVSYPGNLIYETFETIPMSKRIELPVMEDTQVGLSIGLSLVGFIPVSIFSRMDFLIIATNQLVNHLDKIEVMSSGRFKPKVIIRTQIGATKPLYPGAQHCQDHTIALRQLLHNIAVVKLEEPAQVVPAYRNALKSEKSTILIEYAEKAR